MRLRNPWGDGDWTTDDRGFLWVFLVTLILLFTYITAVVSLENLTYVYVALDKTDIILLN